VGLDAGRLGGWLGWGLGGLGSIGKIWYASVRFAK